MMSQASCHAPNAQTQAHTETQTQKFTFYTSPTIAYVRTSPETKLTVSTDKNCPPQRQRTYPLQTALRHRWHHTNSYVDSGGARTRARTSAGDAGAHRLKMLAGYGDDGFFELCAGAKIIGCIGCSVVGWVYENCW